MTATLTRDAVVARLTEAAVEAVYRALGVASFTRGGPNNWLVSSPLREDRHPSFTIRRDDGTWHDLATGAGGDVFGAVKQANGCDFPEALAFVGSFVGLAPNGAHHPAPNGHRERGKQPLAPVVRERRHELREADGIAAVHIRRDRADGTKSFAWEQPDGTPGLAGRPVASLPLYGAQDVQNARSVVLTEGEQACDALRRLRLPAVATVCGAATIPADAVLATIANRRTVYLWPDADAGGLAHMQRIAARLVALGAPAVRMVNWSDAPPKGDAADFVTETTTRADVVALLKRAAPWTPASVAPDALAGPSLVVTSLDDVTSRAVDWLWPRWLPRGKLSLIGGHAGDGKSTLAAALAATLARGGTWPDGTPAPRGRTLFLLAEDALDDTLKPRLEQHNADHARIFAIEAVRDVDGAERTFSLGKHLPLLEQVIRERAIDLVVIDPISAFMAGCDRNAEDVRDVLTPFAKLADRTAVAAVGIMHVGKPTGGSSRRPLQQLLGATAFGAVARVVWIIAPVPDGDDPSRRALGVVKSNLAVRPDVLEWSRREDQPIAWHGTSKHDIEELLIGGRADKQSPERTTIIDLINESPLGLSPQEIANALAKNPSTVRNLLVKMEQSGSVVRLQTGIYATPNHRCVDSVDSSTSTRQTKRSASTESTESTSLRLLKPVDALTLDSTQESMESTHLWGSATVDASVDRCRDCGATLYTSESIHRGTCRTCSEGSAG